MAFDSERFDDGDLFDPALPTRLHATGGKFCFFGHVAFEADPNGLRWVGIRVNGSGGYMALQSTNALQFGETHMSVGTCDELEGFVELVVWQDSGRELKVLNLADYSPHFVAVKVR